MYTVSDVVAVLRDCEAIFASTLLTPEEKAGLSESILQTLPDPSFSPCATQVQIVQGAVRRHKDNQAGTRSDTTDASPAKQGRKAKRGEKPTEVAPEETPVDEAS